MDPIGSVHTPLKMIDRFKPTAVIISGEYAHPLNFER